MRKYVRKIAALFMCFVLAVSLGSVANGVEWVSGSRWKYVETYGNHKRCLIKANATYVLTDWRYGLTRAYNNWNTYSGGYVKVQEASFNDATLTIHTRDGLVGVPENSKVTGMTLIQDTNGNIYSVSSRPSNFGSQIKSAMIVLNNKYSNGKLVSTSDADKNRAKTIGHEIGHCLNLDHRGAYQKSIMNDGWDIDRLNIAGFVNYDRPTTLDISDLSSMYR